MASRFYFDPHADGSAIFLGPTESTLMELAWELDEITVKQAQLYLQQDSNPAYTTVMTVLNRLAEKKLLRRVKDGRHFRYRPTESREEFLSRQFKVVTDCLKRNYVSSAKDNSGWQD